MTKFSIKTLILLQILITMTTGILSYLFAIIIKIEKPIHIFWISSISCFIALIFTIWNIQKTIKNNIKNFGSKNFFEKG